MKNSINTEFKLWLYSKRFVWLFLVICASYMIVTFSDYNVLKSEIMAFQYSENYWDNKEEFKNSLLESTLETNYLALSKQRIEWLLHSLSPKNSLTRCMETGIFAFPLLLTLFGANVMFSDYKNKVIRLRISREGRKNYFFSKYTLLGVSGILICFIAILFDAFWSEILYNKAKSIIVSKYIDISGNVVSSFGNSIYKILFFSLFILIFLELGLCLCHIFKTVIIPVGFIVVIWYINPFRWKYGPANAMYNIAVQLLDFKGTIMILCENINKFICYFELFLLLVIPFFITNIVMKYRSSYNY